MTYSPRARETSGINTGTQSGGSNRLRVSGPNDALEQEADRAAEAIEAGAPATKAWSLSGLSIEPLLQRKCSCGAAPSTGDKYEDCKQGKTLHRRHARTAAQPSTAPSIVHDVLRASGRPLDHATRVFMESQFRHDFRNVRIHTDSTASESSKAVDALAYTVGSHIVFQTGRYVPQNADGRRLLAHELAHVRQHEARDVGARPPILSRQAAPSAKAAPDLSSIVHLDRTSFGDRFDAEVDPRSHRVTLIMSLDFIPTGWGSGDWEGALTRFKPKLKKSVEDAWSDRYGLQSACEGAPDKFHARVRLLVDGAKPHATVMFNPDTPGGRSSAGEGGAALQESDTEAVEHTRPFRKNPNSPPTDRSFSQVPAAHEFGHLMGLSHSHCKGNEDQCYGVTPQEAMDVMGLGSVISEKDYSPFLTIMRLYGQGRLPPECNVWRLVDPG